MNAVKKNKVIYVLDEKAGTYQAWDYATLVMKYRTVNPLLYKIGEVDGEYVVLKWDAEWNRYATPIHRCGTEGEANEFIFDIVEEDFNGLVVDGLIVFTHTEAEAKARLDWLGYK